MSLLEKYKKLLKLPDDGWLTEEQCKFIDPDANSLLEMVLDIESGITRWNIIMETTDIRLLKGIARFGQLYAQLAVASSKNTPAITLAKLSTHYSEEVRDAVERNPNSPPEALESIILLRKYAESQRTFNKT